MNRKPIIGLLVTALLEDEWNKGGEFRPAARASVKRIIDRLGNLGTVVNTGLVESLADAEKARKAFVDRDVDLILSMQLSYTQGMTVLHALRGLDLPLLVWNTQFHDRIPADAAWDVLLVNSGVTGTTEVTSALVRTGRKFAFVNGQFDSPAAWEEISSFVLAATAKKKLEGERIGVIGHQYQWMTDLMVDPLKVMDRFGVIIEHVEEGHVAAGVKAVERTSRTAEYVEKLRASHRVINMDEAALTRSAAYALAVFDIAESRGFSAMSFYEQGLLLHPSVGLTGAMAMCGLYSRGVLSTSEADLLTLVLMMGMSHIAGTSTFLEHYGMDFANNSILLAHDSFGNWDLCDPDEGVTLEPTIFYHGEAGAGVAARFKYRAGDVTVASLVGGPTGTTGDFRLLITEGEALDFTSRPIPAPQMEFAPRSRDIDRYFRTYCSLGGGHHLAGCYGHHASSLTALAELWGIEPSAV